MSFSVDPGHDNKRLAFRVAGFVLCGVGLVLSVIGLVDFFAAFGTFKPPTLFWCMMVGLPLIGLGIACLKAGFLGAAAKYVSEELTPTVAESADFVAKCLGVARHKTQPTRQAANLDKNDPAQRLEQLEKLKRSGLITDDEYSRKRQEILKAL